MVWRGVVCLGLAFGAVGCSEKPKPQPMRIGLNPWPGYALLYAAEARGAFRRADLSIELIPCASLQAAVEAYEHGQLDGLGGTAIELLTIERESARPVVPILATDYSLGNDLLLARGIDRLERLRSKRIAVETGSLGLYLLQRALERGGLRLADVQAVPLSGAEMLKALAAGQVEAVVSYPPYAAEIAALPQVKTLFSSSEIPGEMLDLLLLDASLARDRKDELERFREVWTTTLHEQFADPGATHALIAARIAVDRADWDRALTSFRWLSLDDQPAAIGDGGRLENLLSRLRSMPGFDLEPRHAP